MPKTNSFILRVYVSPVCRLSERVTAVTAEVRRQLPELRIEIVDMESLQEPIPDVVFCVPTYLLNGRVISLGNPDTNFVDKLRNVMNEEVSCK